jgi:hypothetical protein
MFAKIIPGETYFPEPENLSRIGRTLVLTKGIVFFVIMSFGSWRAKGFGAMYILHIQDLNSKANKKSAEGGKL